MSNIFINLIILGFISIVNILIGLFVYLRGRKRVSHSFFALVSLSAGLWVGIGVIRFFYYLEMGFSVYPYIFTKLSVISAISIFYFFLLFSKSFPRISFSFLRPSVIVATLFYFLIILFTLFPGAILKYEIFYPDKIQPSYDWGILYYIFYIPVLLLFFIWSMAKTISSYIHSNNPIVKIQLQYILLGAGLSGIVGIFFGLIVASFPDLVNFFWLGRLSSLIFVIFVSYAIFRYKLMDLRLLFVRTIVFSLIIGIISFIYIALSVATVRFFGNLSGSNSSILSGFLVSILIVLGYQPIRKLVEQATEKFLFKKSYNPDILLAKIAEVTSSIISIKTLLESISNTLNESFKFQKIAIVLLDKEGKLAIAHQQGFDKGVAEKLAAYPDILNILQKEIQQTPGVMVLDEMRTRYENGEFKPISPELLMALTDQDLAVAAPLYVNQQLIGVVVLGNKKSGDSYTQQDVRIIKIISGQVAVAIENAKLYDELKNFSVTLEDEVQKKTLELQRANDELRQLDKAKSEFISIASHQLRTPLTVIKGYISMTREGSFGKVPKKIMENLEKVYASNERLIGLVENLLDISRIESGRQEYVWKEIHLEDLAQTVVDNLKHNAKLRNLKLIFHKPKKKTPLVIIDANKIHEVMMNFVDNAIKYTEKGTIEVSVEPNPKGMVTFCVKDTGRGISEESRNLLFKKFSRGKGSFQVHTEGVGLGLYVAKMLIDAHKGKIWADSEGINKGSTFCFSVPLGEKSKITPVITAEK